MLVLGVITCLNQAPSLGSSEPRRLARSTSLFQSKMKGVSREEAFATKWPCLKAMHHPQNLMIPGGTRGGIESLSKGGVAGVMTLVTGTEGGNVMIPASDMEGVAGMMTLGIDTGGVASVMIQMKREIGGVASMMIQMRKSTRSIIASMIQMMRSTDLRKIVKRKVLQMKRKNHVIARKRWSQQRTSLQSLRTLSRL